MVRRLFVDLETTGDGSNLYHDIIQISARYYENEKHIADFTAQYAHDNSTVFGVGDRVGAINSGKAQYHKSIGCMTSKEGIKDFEVFLKKHLGDNRCFLISYNCEWDEKHLKNWFKKNRLKCPYFLSPCVCVMMLCACKYDRFLTLGNCCEKLGVPVKRDKLHNANYDVFLTVEAYKKLVQKIKAA